MPEYIEREAAVADINTNRQLALITQGLCTDPQQAEIWRFRVGAHECDLDDIATLPAAPVDALVKAARERREAIVAYNACSDNRQKDYPAYVAALLQWNAATLAVLAEADKLAALAALDGGGQG